METPGVYLPMDRRWALALGKELPARTAGAALFADVSGFTPLTEALVRAFGARRGAEELTRHLNLVYSALVAEVHRYGGSVIGFAGDAMTCWFDGDEGLRTTACGLAMQEAIAPFAAVPAPPDGIVTLAIKLAIASGPARRFGVGDPAIQLVDVLAGATLQRMARGEHHARKGELVLDAATAARLGDAVHIADWRAENETGERFAVVDALSEPALPMPWPDLAPHALSDEQTRPWLLPPVYERLRGGQDEFLAELRSAVVLFLSFEGIDYDRDDDAGERLDAFIRRVQRILARYEGYLLQVIVGDKGSYLYAAFGALIAHDDDDARAVAAALELRAPRGTPSDGVDVTGHGFSAISHIRIGVSRGRMRVGAYGGAARRTYGVLGDEVNVAARLMGQAAPGQILVSEPVAVAASRHYHMQEIGLIAVKGKAEPLLVSAVRGQRPPSSRRPATLYQQPLVGRAAELERLEGILAASYGGAGQILRVEGAAGVGKSHLAAELVERASGRGMRVVLGVCQSTAQETAYAPWRQVFRALLGLDEHEGEEPSAEAARHIAVIESLARQTKPDWLLRLPLLGDLLGLPIPDNATTAAFEPSLRRNALFDLAVEMAGRFAHAQPLLVLIDDVHWIDAASRGLAVTLGRALSAAPMTLALLHRPPLHDSPILPELSALPYHHLLSLNDLTAAAVAALIAGRLGAEVTPLALALIASEAQGNPFFTEEMVDSLREAGSLIRRDDGRWDVSESLFMMLRQSGSLDRAEGEWVLAPGASLNAVALGLPDSVEGMVLSRIDRLPDAAKLTLRVASVIGRVFALDVLALAHPLRPTREALAEQIDTLLARDFARLELPPPNPSYIFKHNVTHEAAYDTLLFAQRRDLHRAAGLALEQIAPDAVAQLARHTFLGEDWERSLRYQTLAGRQARRLFANHEGIEHIKRALHSAEHLPAAQTAAPRLALHADLGELLTSTSQYEPAQQQLSQALALADQLHDPAARARVCRWLARLYELRGDFTAALGWIQQALDALAGRETADVAEALITAGLIYMRQGDYTRAQEQVKQSLHIGAQIGDKSVLARANHLLGVIPLTRGNNILAIELFQRALGFYRQSENSHGQGLVHNGLANAYFALGQWQDAIQHYRQAREIFRQTGDVYYEAVAGNNLGGIARDQGRLDDAVAYYQDGLRSLAQIGGSPYILSGVHMNLGATFIRRDDLAEAQHHLAISRDYVAQAQLRDWLPELHRLLAEAALLGEDVAEAELEGRQSLDLARELAMQGEEGRTLRVLGEIARTQGSLDTAESFLTQSIQLLRASGEEFEEGRSQLALARTLLARRQVTRARTALERCSAIFERLDARLDLNVARALSAECANYTPAPHDA